jgi:membrane associated rhomboid family serine protease
MSQPPQNALEVVLRLVAAAAPGPWHPRAYAQKHEIDRETMETLLMDLWLEGLIERAGGNPSAGPGVTLTDRGREVLGDPELLARLRAGHSVGTDPRRTAIREALTGRRKPHLTRLLLLANLAVFAWGLSLAWPQNLVRDYLSGPALFGRGGRLDERLPGIWHTIGAVRPEDLAGAPQWWPLPGWWQLLMASFVHAGLLHLALNMFGLYMVGRQLEGTWGRWRLLVIYLLSAWASVCISQARQFSPIFAQWKITPTMGASGAVCGMIGAEIVWLLANRRFLPPLLRKRAYGGMVFNLLMLAMFTLVPGTGTWGHLGGLIVGAAVAVLLHFQRFGPALFRGPALIAVALVPVAVFLFLRHAQNTQPFWRELQDESFQQHLPTRANAVTKQAWEFFDTKVGPQVERHPARRDAAAVAAILPQIPEHQDKLSRLVLELEQAGPRFDEGLEEGRIAGRDYAQALVDLLDLSEHCLRSGEKSPPAQERRLEKQIRTTEELRNAWRARLERP